MFFTVCAYSETTKFCQGDELSKLTSVWGFFFFFNVLVHVHEWQDYYSVNRMILIIILFVWLFFSSKCNSHEYQILGDFICRLPENVKKNRYTDVLCLEDSRVKLVDLDDSLVSSLIKLFLNINAQQDLKL